MLRETPTDSDGWAPLQPGSPRFKGRTRLIYKPSTATTAVLAALLDIPSWPVPSLLHLLGLATPLVENL